MELWDFVMQNMLKLSDEKWYFIWFSQKCFTNKTSIFTIFHSEGICCSYFIM